MIHPVKRRKDLRELQRHERRTDRQARQRHPLAAMYERIDEDLADV